MADSPKSSDDRDRADRERLRAQGLWPLQLRLPDVRSMAFRTEAHRQSQAVAKGSHAQKAKQFMNAVSDLQLP